MGASESYDPNGHAEYSSTSFGEGRSRRAYKGTYRSPSYKAGDPCVVKEYKHSYAWAKGDWNTAVKLQNKSIQLATKFNEAISTTRPIKYVWSDVWQVAKSSGTPRLGEWCMVEDYIEGQWEKWNSNAGYVNTDAPTQSLHAFSHWTWAHSGGKLLLCDLQGVRYDNKYTLTDPVINSVNQEYGECDMGVGGIALFFSTHTCTSFCKRERVQLDRYG